MSTFADISIRFGADLSQFSTQMQNAQRQLNRIGKRFEDIGENLTKKVSLPLVGLGVLALDAAADFEALESQLTTALGSSGLAKQTFEELQSFTKDLSITTEEAVQSYIRLKNLGLDPTIEALESYGNTASAQGKSVNQLIEAVADAATGEFERLKEFGIKASKEGENVTFTFQGLSTTVGNNAQEIQGYLQELGSTTFAGALANEAETTKGFFKIILDDLRNISAEFGDVIIQGIEPFREGIRNVLESIRELSPETKRFLVIFGGIAAAVGPLLALAGTILPAIGTGFALLTGPIGLIVAGLTAIGVIIYKNWAPIRGTLIEIANYFIDLYNEALVFRAAVEAIRTSFNNIYDTGRFVFRTLGLFIGNLADNIKENFKNIGDIIKAVLTGNFEELPVILARNFNAVTDNFKKLVEDAKTEFGDLQDTISENITEGIDRSFRNRYELLSDNVETTEVEDKIEKTTADSFKKGIKAGVSSVAKDRDLFTGLGTAFRDEFAGAFGGRVLNDEELDAQFSGFSSTLDEGIDKVKEFDERSGEILEGAAETFVTGFAGIVGAVASGNAGLASIGGFLVNTMADIAISLGRAAIQIGITMDALKKAFSVPFLAIGAGAALVALGTLLKGVAGNFAGNFTDGGLVPGTSFSGDRLLAGVNSGELILNIAQQRNLAAAIQANNREVTLMPSLEYSMEGFRVRLNRIENRNNRTT